MENEKLIARMKELNIDIQLSRKILNKINDPGWTEPEPVHPRRIPGIDGEHILDMRGEDPFRLNESLFRRRAEELNLPEALTEDIPTDKGSVLISRPRLAEIGLALLPLVSYGVLNGGSASSYADTKKNRGFSGPLFNLCSESFEKAAEKCRGKAKGITPAFIHPDGSPGPSFMELKMRAVLIQALKYHSKYGTNASPVPLAPLFQMTSVLNDEQIREAFEQYRRSPLLAGLIEAAGIDVTDVISKRQPLVSAFTPDEKGKKRIFSTAYGKTDEPLPFPGGHGQNFAVLKAVYQDLHAMGKKYVYIGNVDNLGNLPDPAGIALLALSGKEAAFDFSFKTPVDVKGGILVEDQQGRLNCADIGVAIPRETVEAREAEGKPILFNCATGLFSLDHLVPRLDDIIENLPLRTSIQDKDPGRYAQTEQVTWEVMGILEDFLVLGVDKYDRFLASKLLLENLLTSGIGLDDPDFPRDEDPSRDLHRLGTVLNRGLEAKLTGEYGMERKGGRWEPVPPEKLF